MGIDLCVPCCVCVRVCRYQLIGGLDRFLFDRTNFLWTYVALSGAARLASNQVGELSRPWWQGLPAPSTLPPIGASYTPPPRRVRRKVSKKVPRSKLGQRQQEQQAALAATQGQLEAAPLAMAAAVSLPAGAQPELPADVASTSAPAMASAQGDSVEASALQGSVVVASSSGDVAAPVAHLPSSLEQSDSVEDQQRGVSESEVAPEPAPTTPLALRQ